LVKSTTISCFFFEKAKLFPILGEIFVVSKFRPAAIGVGVCGRGRNFACLKQYAKSLPLCKGRQENAQQSRDLKIKVATTDTIVSIFAAFMA
jgi:hypothetical protein